MRLSARTGDPDKAMQTLDGHSDFVTAVKQAPEGQLGLLVTRQGQGLFVTID